MRQGFWRRLVAAAVGAAALAGSASAEHPLSPVISSPVVIAQPAPGPTAPTVGVPAPAPVVAVPQAPAAVAPAGPVVPTSGCASCAAAAHPVGTAARGFVMNVSGGYVGTSCQTGQNCNNGCGSLKSDLGVVFGSCRSFFAPCGPRPLSCGHGGCGGGLCGGGLFSGCNHTPVYGTGPCGPFNPCIYDSYLNH